MCYKPQTCTIGDETVIQNLYVKTSYKILLLLLSISGQFFVPIFFPLGYQGFREKDVLLLGPYCAHQVLSDGAYAKGKGSY